MEEMKRTVIFVVAAAVLIFLTVVTTPRERVAEVFNDQGQPLFPEFTDPVAATSLEIIDYDAATAVARPFKVEFKNSRWAIPSHHNYPADAKDRLKKTAAAIIDLKKDIVCSDRTQDHDELSVIDPFDAKVTGLKGRGKRITLRNKDGLALADLIIGKDVPNKTDYKYVRLPDQKRTYATKISYEISSKFGDWIETDLLQVEGSKIRKFALNSYRLEENFQRIRIVGQESLELTKENNSWKLPEVKDTEEINTEAVNEMTGAADDLKIIGVRLKPPGLSKELKKTGEVEFDPVSLMSLQQKGYFLSHEGDLFSKHGELRIATEEGIEYLLRFGEVFVGEGEEVTAGTEPQEKKEDDKKTGPENRYLFVIASFDETFLKAPGDPPKEEAIPADATPEKKKEIEDRNKKAKDEYEQKKKDHEKKIEDGKKKAQELQERFADWYYVISADLYKKLRKERKDLVKTKSSEKKLDTPEPNETEEENPDEQP